MSRLESPGSSRREDVKRPYYVTTAITYPNGDPHVGHAYEYIATDAIARFKRLDGFDVTQSWDCAFRDTKSSDYVVGQVWAKRGADSHLVYELWRRLSFTQTLDAVRHLTWMFPQSRRKIIEGKANGDAVIDSLHQPVPRRDLPHWRGGVDHRPHRKDPALQRQATGTTSARAVPTTHQ